MAVLSADALRMGRYPVPMAQVVRLSGWSRNFRNFQAAACFAALDLFTMNSSPPLTSTPPFALLVGEGSGATPSSTLGTFPAESTAEMVPNAALVSNAI